MQRRQLLKVLGVSTLGVAAAGASVPVLAQSNFGGEEGLVIETDISNNHDHEFTIATVDDIILMLRDVRENGPMEIDITGQSGHGHFIVLDEDALIEILAVGEVEVESDGSGHTHGVFISLLPANS